MQRNFYQCIVLSYLEINYLQPFSTKVQEILKAEDLVGRDYLDLYPELTLVLYTITTSSTLVLSITHYTSISSILLLELIGCQKGQYERTTHSLSRLKEMHNA